MTDLTAAPGLPEPLHTALRALLRVHAPGASLLAVGQGGQVLRLEPGGGTRVGGELVPPDEWLDRGELAWLTRGGALLGLLWSADAPLQPGAVEVLTLLLSAAQEGRAQREAEVLITQLPVPAAWLSADLTFRQVSRPWLELFGQTGDAVMGRTLAEVLPQCEACRAGLMQAAAGRALRLPDLRLSVAGGGRAWLRGEARPYFGGEAAGVLWTLQDVTAEHAEAAHLAALLQGTGTPTALLQLDGTVLHASSGLTELAPGWTPLAGQVLWAWPGFAGAPSEAVQHLVRRAVRDGLAGADVPLERGGALTLGLRRVAAGAGAAEELLVLEARPGPEAWAEAGG
ncbi:PAS domain-containing protein [Deinococcus carri]